MLKSIYVTSTKNDPCKCYGKNSRNNAIAHTANYTKTTSRDPEEIN